MDAEAEEAKRDEAREPAIVSEVAVEESQRRSP
jgi:hypothetical protein